MSSKNFSSSKSFDRAFAAVATAAVMAAIAAGFWVLGTPGRQREIAADRQRVRDIKIIAGRIHDRYLNALNAENDSFQAPDSLEAQDQPNDPLTNQPYDYQKLDDLIFELCADFNTDSSTHRLSDADSLPDADRWQHPQGRHCFEFDLTEFPTPVW